LVFSSAMKNYSEFCSGVKGRGLSHARRRGARLLAA
jgi:hypothetical protein